MASKLFLLFALLAVSGFGASADSNPASVDVGAAAVASHPADQELADAPVVPKGNAGAIECFQCNSLEDASCEKTHKAIKEKYLKPCPIKDRQSAIGCWKLSQKVDYDQNEELTAHERVVRQCAYIGQDAPCANRAGVGGITNQCFCNTTRCNHSAGLRGSPIFALVSTFVVLFLAKLAIA